MLKTFDILDAETSVSPDSQSVFDGSETNVEQQVYDLSMEMK